MGRMSLGQLHNGSGAAPVGMPLVYIAPPPKPSAEKAASSSAVEGPAAVDAVIKASDDAGKSSDDDPASALKGASMNAAEEALNAAMRDAKINFLKVGFGKECVAWTGSSAGICVHGVGGPHYLGPGLA